MSTTDTQRSVEPGALVTLTPDGMGPLGECTGTLDGVPVTVFGGIPGERVEAEVVRRYRDHTALRVVGVPEPSAHRTAPPCPFFWPCTGCQWQHISYDHQLELKQRAVENALGGAPGLDGVRVLPTLPSPQQYGYRNHARFTIGPEGALGFVNRITRRFVRVGLCGIMAPWINETPGQAPGPLRRDDAALHPSRGEHGGRPHPTQGWWAPGRSLKRGRSTTKSDWADDASASPRRPSSRSTRQGRRRCSSTWLAGSS